MRRTLTWLVTLPFAAASVLIGHKVAYAVTGTPTGGMHDYLAHAPQVVFILASLALLGLATDARARSHSAVPLASLGVGAFVAQEAVSDASELDPVIDAIIAANPDQAAAFRSGKEGLLGFFVGQVMKETGGSANPRVVSELVRAKLG